MRSISSLVLIALLAGCASSEPAPAPKAAAPATTPAPVQAAAPAPAPAPRCYSGDSGKFHPVGEKTSIAGVDVTCTATTDGKSAQWASAAGHKK